MPRGIYLHKLHSEETKKKISQSMKGSKGWLGHHHSEETKLRISLAQRGEKSWNWKGGKHLKYIRWKLNRKGLDFVTLNNPFEDSEGHHIDRIFVIFIPKKIHRSIFHRQDRPETMKKINNIAYQYLMKPLFS